LLHRFLAFRVSTLGVDAANKTMTDAARVKYLSVIALLRCVFQVRWFSKNHNSKSSKKTIRFRLHNDA
jgi:hypothetical protein